MQQSNTIECWYHTVLSSFICSTIIRLFPTPLNNTYFVVLYVIQQPVAQCMLCKGNTNDLLLFASIGDKITGTSTTQCVSQQQSQADSLVQAFYCPSISTTAMGRAACLLPWAERLSSELCKNQEVTFFKNQNFLKIPNLDITVIVEALVYIYQRTVLCRRFIAPQSQLSSHCSLLR